MWHLLEGSVYFIQLVIHGRCLLEGGFYFIQLLIHGRCLLEGGVYWRAPFIGINMVVVYATIKITIRGITIPLYEFAAEQKKEHKLE